MKNHSPIDLPDDLKRLLYAPYQTQEECAECYANGAERISQLSSHIRFPSKVNKKNEDDNEDEQTEEKEIITFSDYSETNTMNNNRFWKYNEDKILKQLEEYIASTYSQHYVDRTGGGTEQTLDKIKHNRREGFCAGNVTKYIDRYDTKGTPRADLFKVLHYTILLINHLNLIENK